MLRRAASVRPCGRQDGRRHVKVSRRWQRKVLWITGLGAILTIAAGMFYHRPLLSYLVTKLAFDDADEIVRRVAAFRPGDKRASSEFEQGTTSLAESYGYYFLPARSSPWCS